MSNTYTTRIDNACFTAISKLVQALDLNAFPIMHILRSNLCIFRTFSASHIHDLVRIASTSLLPFPDGDEFSRL